MEKKLVLCDTNIFIHWFLKHQETHKILNEQIGIENIAIPSITYMELCQGTDNKKELEKLTKNLNSFPVIHFDREVSKLANELMQRFYLSHSMQIPDAIIASTSIISNLPLFTYNKKDFQFIPKIKLY